MQRHKCIPKKKKKKELTHVLCLGGQFPISDTLFLVGIDLGKKFSTSNYV